MTKSKKIISLALAAIMTIGAAGVIVAGTSGAFREKEYKAELESSIEKDDNGGAVLETAGLKNMSVRMAKIPASLYAANAVSENAETAYTVNVTVLPVEAENKEVDWKAEFVNPASAWANGKSVKDYVTVTPKSDGSTQAVVACKKAFGEQVKITITSRDNPNVSGTCLVDYAQKVTNAKLSFGDIQCVKDGNTSVAFEIAAGVTGAGGTAKFEYDTSVYTVAETFTTTYEISYDGKAVGNASAVTFDDLDLLSDDIEGGNAVTFDLGFMKKYGAKASVGGTTITGNLWNGTAGSIFMKNVATENKNSFVAMPITIKTTVSGEHSSYSYTTTIYVTATTNNSTIESITPDKTQILF